MFYRNITMRVREPGKQPHTFQVDDWHLVQEFRKMVHDKMGVEPNKQLLIYDAVIIKDYYNDREADLHDYFKACKFA